MTRGNFIYVEMASGDLGTGKPFDGFIPGTFTDMWGQKVVIDPDDLNQFLENTLAAIETTKTESGELVGLPIDAFGHDHGDGAGWIIDASIGENNFGKVVRFTPKWTEAGIDLIRKGIRRFFSPTVDLDQLVIVGGSLTNWPASRKKNGQIMLRPIELSQPFFGYTPEDEPGENEISGVETMDNEKITELSGKIEALTSLVEGLTDKVAAVTVPATNADGGGSDPTPPQTIADLIGLLDMEGATDTVAENFKTALIGQFEQMRQRAAQEAADLIANQRRESSIVDLSAKLTGGTPDNPKGLSVKSDDLKDFLMSLNAAQLSKATAIFDQVWRGGLVDFSEMGSNRQDAQRKLALPMELQTALNSGEMTVADLSMPVITEWIGAIDQYDLSAWKK